MKRSVYILCLFVHLVYGQTPCRSSSGNSGVCTEPRVCSTVLAEIAQKSRTEALGILQSYRTCRENWLLCCPTPEEPRPPQQQPPRTVPTSNLLPTDCGEFTVHTIRGGERAEINEFPWAVMLNYGKSGRRDFKCGGTLINGRYVVTAAHCLDQANLDGWSLLSVRLGETNTDTETECNNSVNKCNDPPQDIPIERRIVHSSYQGGQSPDNDIALLRLQRNVQFSDYIKPVCLPSNVQELGDYVNEDGTAVGWGLIGFAQASKWKMKVNLPIVSRQECSQKFLTIQGNVRQSHICAGTGSQSTCRGDSGGSLSLKNRSNKWMLIGITSFGHQTCGKIGFPSVFTKVADYMDWIVQNLSP